MHLILGQIDIEPLLKAADSFKKGVGLVNDDLHRDGVIQRFEFTFELCWKTLKRVLEFKGVTHTNPRDVLRAAAQSGYVKDVKLWFSFLEKRNLTAHTYNESTAVKIFSAMASFEKELDSLVDTLKNLK